jgi:hypothetical protein
MPWRDDFVLDLLENLGGVVLKFLMTTLRWQIFDEHKYGVARREHGPLIWAFWHSRLAFGAFMGRGRGYRILVSTHRDGEIGARLGKGLGFEAVRGSTTRGGLEGVTRLAETGRHLEFAITPDGPRGPREQAQRGAIVLAQVTGRPIQPLGAAARPCIRLGSWDRFIVPIPFGLATLVAGDPIIVPKELTAEAREEYRLKLETELKRVNDLAEKMCERWRGGQSHVLTKWWIQKHLWGTGSR